MTSSKNNILIPCLLLVTSIILTGSLFFIKYLPVEISKYVGFSIVCATVFTTFGFFHGIAKIYNAADTTRGKTLAPQPQSLEITDWITPFNSGDLCIINIRWGEPDWFVEYPSKRKRYEIKNNFNSDENGLTITVFHLDTESVYEILFGDAGAFRMLDEHGLTEIWTSGKKPRGINCFKVRNHGWSKESPLSFFMKSKDGWSYLVATDFECIEIIAKEPPKIIFKEKLKPVNIGP
jgi:hypothetical protein